jgi:hypothetical protein
VCIYVCVFVYVCVCIFVCVVCLNYYKEQKPSKLKKSIQGVVEVLEGNECTTLKCDVMCGVLTVHS